MNLTVVCCAIAHFHPCWRGWWESRSILRIAGRKRNFTVKKLLRTCGRSLCASCETPTSATPRPHRHALGARTAASHLPPVTKAKTKAVRQGGDAPSHKVDRFRRRDGFLPGHQVPLPAVREHHP